MHRPDSFSLWSSDRWTIRFAVIFMLLTSLPYLLAYSSQGTDWVFSGFLFGVEDGHSYIAKMLSGAYGSWLFRTPYTPEPQNGALAFLPYLLLGKLTAPPSQHEQLVAVFHLFRFGAGILAVLATERFLAVFIKDVRIRRWALILAVAGGGLGWLVVLLGRSDWLGSLPLDFMSPETFGFLALYGLPHLALARALLLWGLAGYLAVPLEVVGVLPTFKGILRKPFDRTGILIGCLWLLLGLMQPLTVLIGWLILGMHLLIWGSASLVWREKVGNPYRASWWLSLRRAAWMILFSAPVPLYTFVAFRLDPFLRAWTDQNLITSPHPLHYLLAYGLVLPFAFWGARRLLEHSPWQGWLLVGWLIALPFLLYAPFNLQRRLAEGAWVALVAMAGTGSPIGGNTGRVDVLRFRLFRWATLASLPSTLFLFAGGMLSTAVPNSPIFLPASEVYAFQSLAETAHPGDTVLAAYPTSNALPAWVPVKVVAGHGPESAGLPEKLRQVEKFYTSATSQEERWRILEAYSVEYVFWGPAERSLGNWHPGAESFLVPIFAGEEYSIYQVVRGEARSNKP